MIKPTPKQILAAAVAALTAAAAYGVTKGTLAPEPSWREVRALCPDTLQRVFAVEMPTELLGALSGGTVPLSASLPVQVRGDSVFYRPARGTWERQRVARDTAATIGIGKSARPVFVCTDARAVLVPTLRPDTARAATRSTLPLLALDDWTDTTATSQP